MKHLYLTFFTILCVNTYAAAHRADSTKVIPGHKNLVKINLPTLALRTYALEYERAIGKKTAISLGYRFMPNGGIPMKNKFFELINDPKTKDQLNDFTTSNYAITPQIKFYFGKDIFKGFYLAPFARIAKYKAAGHYKYDNNGSTESIPLNGDLNTITGGLELGVQFRLGKAVHLNFNFGPQYGSANGNIAGQKSLNQSEQNALKSDLEGINIPYVTKEVTVDGNGAKVKMNGPWAGIKAGIMLGFRF